MAKQSVSIYDIAQIAGVSPASVSKILNGKGSFSERTRASVIAVAEREGYVPNLAAKGLRSSQSHAVGVLTPDVSNDFFSSIVRNIEKGMYAQGYNTFVCDTDNDPEREAAYARSLLQRQVDGLAFVGGALTALPASVANGSVPVVCVDRLATNLPSLGVSLGSDAHAMAMDATRALVSHGARSVAFVNVARTTPTTMEDPRHAGYVHALEGAGIQLDRNFILEGRHELPSNAEASMLVGRCLAEGRRPQAYACMGDRVALGVSSALLAHGMTPGKDALVIGTDDAIYACIVTPSLSSVNRNVGRMAAAAVEALVSMIGGTAPAERSIVIPHEVVERSSTLG